MKKLTLGVVIVLVIAAVVAVSVSNPINTNQEETISCDIDKVKIGDREGACPQGYTCYYSTLQPKGGEVLEVVGDSLCHKDCEVDDDCPSNMPICDYITIWSGDAGELKGICNSE